MKVLVVFDHPRRSSFCGAVLDAFISGLAEAGHHAEIADLRAEGFDPRLPPEDEPDWDMPQKRYSEAVLAEQARISRNDALAFVFPVWWWSMPATLKGWIDRVWNNGWAYGEARLPHRRAVLMGTAASSAEGFAKRGYDRAMEVQLVTGIMNYCGIEDAELRLFYDVTGEAAVRLAALEQARTLGHRFERAANS